MRTPAIILLMLLVASLAAADPAIAPLADRELDEDFPLQVFPLLGITGDGELTISALSSAPMVVPHPYVVYASPMATGQLVVAAAADASGSATITVTVSDAFGHSADSRFSITVVPVNDAPHVDPVGALTLLEDVGTVVTLTGISPGPAGEEGQGLRFLLSDDGPHRLELVAVDYTPGATTAQLTLRSAADANGSASAVLTVIDDGGTAEGGIDSFSRRCSVEITPINDPPILSVDLPLPVGRGGAAVLAAGQLQAVDADGDPIAWTLLAAPAHGTLFRVIDHAALAAGEVFFQSDIDAGRVLYEHDGSAGPADQITLAFSDGLSPASAAVTLAMPIFEPVLPEVIPLPGTATWLEGGPDVAVAPLALVRGGGSSDFSGGTLIIKIQAGGRFGDDLFFGLCPSGTAVGMDQNQGLRYGPLTIGTWGTVQTGGVTDGQIFPILYLYASFTSPLATPAVVQDLLRGVRFRNTTGNPGGGARSIEVVVDDGNRGSSDPGLSTIQVQPVDGPPVVAIASIAVPTGITRQLTLIASDDQDVPHLTWSLLSVSPDISASFVDAAAGRLQLRAPWGVAGSRSLTVAVSDGVNPPVTAVFPVVVTDLSDPRPYPAGELPGEVFRGESLVVSIPFDCRQLPGADLDFAIASDSPAGLSVTRAGATTAIISWLVPDSEALGHRQLTLLAIDRTTQACGALPVSVPVRPHPVGVD